jgi:hypothetical protein
MAAIICADCRKTGLIDNVKGRCATCYSRYLRSKKRTKALACEVCKFGFQSARRDARFCSDACRQWSYRERRLLRMGWGVNSLARRGCGPVGLVQTQKVGIKYKKPLSYSDPIRSWRLANRARAPTVLSSLGPKEKRAFQWPTMFRRSLASS